MRILFQYLTGGGGALSNIILLLQALSKQFPQDHIDIVCSKTSGLSSLATLPNIDILPYGGNRHQELDRVFLGFGGLGRIAKERGSDVIWSLNLGSYVKTSIPQILSVHNSHQVYPWKVTQYHPDNRLHVAVLRWFFRKSLRASVGVIVQTPIMGKYVQKISGAPNLYKIAPKAVENNRDVLSDELPDDLQKMFSDGLGRQAFTFLFVATFTPHKNHKTLVETFDILATEGLNVRVVFTLGYEELISFGGEKARRLIGSGHIIPAGWIEKKYLKKLYEACDACLMPSVLESLSSAHLEAMQWSKPQIVSDLPYAKDLCGVAALYAQAEKPADWAQKIREFVLDKKLRENLVTAGHEQMKHFPLTWADAAIHVHTFLEEIFTVRKEQS